MAHHTRSLLLLVAAVLATAPACGSDPDDAQPTAPSSAETPTTAEVPSAPAAPSATATMVPGTRPHGSLAQCLREHGVSEPSGPAAGPAPGPAAAPSGVDQATWDQAVQACAAPGE